MIFVTKAYCGTESNLNFFKATFIISIWSACDITSTFKKSALLSQELVKEILILVNSFLEKNFISL